MSSAVAKPAPPETPTLSYRFWSLAKGAPIEDLHPDEIDPAAVVKHTLAILDALSQGETGDALSVSTLSFLKLLRQHELAGELSYASPEQIRGETMDERSLVFSVGVLLFERLTARHPFGAENNQPRRVARIRRGEFGSGVNYFPTVSAGLRSILMRSMGPFPEERFATLAELRSNLESYVSEVRVPPPLPGTRSPTSDAQTTRVVDMSKVAQGERAVAHLRAPGLRGVDVRAFDEPTVGDGDAPSRAMERAQTTVLERRKHQRRREQRGATPAPTDDELFAPPPRQRARLMPLAYAAAGAAVASVVFFALGARNQTETTAAANATTPSPTPSITAAPATDRNARPTIDTAKATKATKATTATTATAPAAAASTFDPTLGGERILSLGRSCFSASRLRRGVAFGLGVVYPNIASKPRKLFFSGSKELSRNERRCLTRTLTHLVPGALPHKPQLIDYWLKLSTSSKSVRVKPSSK